MRGNSCVFSGKCWATLGQHWSMMCQFCINFVDSVWGEVGQFCLEFGKLGDSKRTWSIRTILSELGHCWLEHRQFWATSAIGGVVSPIFGEDGQFWFDVRPSLLELVNSGVVSIHLCEVGGFLMHFDPGELGQGGVANSDSNSVTFRRSWRGEGGRGIGGRGI